MEQLQRILFIDIETVPYLQEYSQLSPVMQEQWQKKAKHLKVSDGENLDAASLFAGRAGVFSEFAKVVCIGFGSLHQHDDGWKLRLKSLQHDDEKVLLKEFCDVLKRFTTHYPDLKFSGHNIKEFDIPFLCRRMIINGMSLPECMQLQGKKPWEISHIDTLELWRFGDYKNYTSLALLAEVLGVPSPKDDLDGSMVAPVYWQEHDLPRIAKYCLQDVLTSARVYLRLSGIHDVDPQLIFVNE